MNLLKNNVAEFQRPMLKKYGVIVKKGNKPDEMGHVLTHLPILEWCTINGYVLLEKRSEHVAGIGERPGVDLL